MARVDYQHQLESLREDVVAMSDLVLERYDQALSALEEKDAATARDVIEGDQEINERYLELEGDCIDLFALQQPVAGDLRFVASSFKVVTDLERIGDLAVNLAQYGLAAEEDRYPEVDAIQLGAETGAMVADAMAAYEAGDADAARRVAARDDHVDDRCERASVIVVQDLLLNDGSGDQAAIVDDVSRLLLTIRDLERVGDHAVNVCARTVYMVEHDEGLIY